MKKVLKGLVMIKKLDGSIKLESGLVQQEDSLNLPKARILLIADGLEDIVKVGDEVYYMESRERGRVFEKEEECFIIPIANIMAVI